MPDAAMGPIEHTALIRLMAWLSPSFPTGSFAYSAGLEAAFLKGQVTGGEDLKYWLEDLLEQGWIWNDAIICREAHRMQTEQLPMDILQETAEAIAGSAERYAETLAVGASFRAAAVSWPGAVTSNLPARCALPLAVGSVGAALGVPVGAVLAAFLQATVSGQIQAALRLAPIGQTKGVELLARLEETILIVTERATAASLDDLCTTTIIAEAVGLQHASLESRIFKS